MADDDKLGQLQRSLEEVAAERDRLADENRRLLAELKRLDRSGTAGLAGSKAASSPSPESAALQAAKTPVGQEPCLADKISLFRSLFAGRQDVFARLWKSRRTGQVGYSPVCTHEWNPALCNKPRTRCGQCPNRDFAPVTDVVFQDHLEGRHVVGIYSLHPDDTCRLLAIDFDKQSWMEDVAAFMETCRSIHVPAVVERSRSGNGAHVWIFFAEAVPASTARKLGCYLVTETMSHHHHLGMDSYDRLFPNQDTMPKGGLGNLIALPLQKGPGERGNTLFLDPGLKPYQDQWAFLASIMRMDASALEGLVHEADRSGQVIGVRASPTEEDERPWAVMPSKRLLGPPLIGPFPARIRAVMGNLLFIEKHGLSSSLLNRIKRLAAFQNPEFYKRQSMRLSVSLTPRVICCAEEFPNHLAIPRGCLDELGEMVETVGAKIEVIDERCGGSEIKVTFQGQLTSAQEASVSALARHDDGVLVAPAGSGKTVVGIHMIAARNVNTLVLVHRRPLLEQWRTQLANFLQVDPKTIGQIGGGKDNRTGVIDVAMMQSLVRKGQVGDVVTEYGHVIVDECHHLPAVTFEQVLRQVKARFVLGLTATPYRRDGHQPIILMQCGPVRHVVSQKDGWSQGLLRRRLVCRDTNFTLPVQDTEPSIHDIYAALVADETRNQLILDDLLRAVKQGRSPILLTERREHLEFFASRLAGLARHVVVLRGGMGARQRREVAERLAAIPGNEERVLLATGRYIGEGFDDARLDTLFLAMPVSWKGTLVQYAGRLHRLRAGKAEVIIHDYVDRGSPTLVRMFQRRLRGYRSMGYEPDNLDQRKRTGAGFLL